MTLRPTKQIHQPMISKIHILADHDLNGLLHITIWRVEKKTPSNQQLLDIMGKRKTHKNLPTMGKTDPCKEDSKRL
jgi:hypothetical protein